MLVITDYKIENYIEDIVIVYMFELPFWCYIWSKSLVINTYSIFSFGSYSWLCDWGMETCTSCSWLLSSWINTKLCLTNYGWVNFLFAYYLSHPCFHIIFYWWHDKWVRNIKFRRCFREKCFMKNWFRKRCFRKRD